MLQSMLTVSNRYLALQMSLTNVDRNVTRKYMLNLENSESSVDKCPAKMVSPDGAAELLDRTRQRAVAVYLPRLFFSNPIYLARPRHESALWRGVSLFLKKYAIGRQKSCSDRAHCQQEPDNGQSGGTEYQRKRLQEVALISQCLSGEKGRNMTKTGE